MARNGIGHAGDDRVEPVRGPTDSFAPGQAGFMVNDRVDDLDGLLARLRAAGVEPVGEVLEES
jgi:hypothetical protein